MPATARQNFIAALEGEKPERVPFMVLDEFMGDEPEWPQFAARGMCRVPFAWVIGEELDGVEREESAVDLEGKEAWRTTLKTPVGSITSVAIGDWVQEYYLKEPVDYRVAEYVVRHTTLSLNAGEFDRQEKRMGEDGLTFLDVGRTPMQTMLVDYAGLENFSAHLMDGIPEIESLAGALMEQFLKKCELMASGPGRYVRLLENFTAEAWGPERYRRIHMPAYEKMMPMFRKGGKKVYAHYDGKMSRVANLIAKTPLDGIDGATEPPEGDMTFAEYRRALPDKFLLGNINVSLHGLPAAALSGVVARMARELAPDGRLASLGIHEDLPAKWRESIPAILDTLAAL